MATTGVAAAVGRRARAFALSETALCRLALAALFVWQTGAYVDGWYHLHYGFAIESFLTWSHALLYGGWAATAAVPLLYLVGRAREGVSRAVLAPPGIGLTLLGCGLFGLGGLFDAGWHAAFGFEARQEALLTPAHLWLDIAFLVAACGLLRHALHLRAATGAPTYRPRPVDLPPLLALAALFSGALWNLTYIAPLSIDFAAGGAHTGGVPGYAGIAFGGETAQIAGTGGMLLHAIVVALFVVAPLRWLRLPGGAVATVLLVEGLQIAAATGFWAALPAVVAAAAVGEAIWAALWRGGPTALAREAGYWLIGGAVPASLVAAYLAILAASGGVGWTAHLVGGLPALAALYGAIVGVVVAPPRWARQAVD